VYLVTGEMGAILAHVQKCGNYGNYASNISLNKYSELNHNISVDLDNHKQNVHGKKVLELFATSVYSKADSEC
jgi:hypothetical protein